MHVPIPKKIASYPWSNNLVTVIDCELSPSINGLPNSIYSNRTIQLVYTKPHPL